MCTGHLRRFANDVKGDALYMMELVLSLEKLNFHKLRLLHDIACKHDDAEMADFIGGHFLASLMLNLLCRPLQSSATSQWRLQVHRTTASPRLLG